MLIADNIAEEGLKIFQNYKDIHVDVKTKHTEQELIDIIEPYHAVIIRSATTMTAAVINAAKNLKVITRAGTGYDNIDIDACNKKGVVVLITPLGNVNAVVELTMGLMLDAARKISQATLLMSQGKWEKKKLEGTELKGKTVGVIGLGRIGAQVAKRCMAFEMNVIAFDQFVPKKYAEDLGVKLVELDDLLKNSDYITIHTPLTPQTQNLIDKPQIEKMKKNAVIINVARGGVVNEKTLFETLKENKIAGACIDVYSEEPAAPDKFPIIGLPNSICLPHLGASTVEAQINVAVLAAQNTIQALTSNIFIDAVNVPFNLPANMADLYRPFMLLGSYLGSIISQHLKEKLVDVKIKYKGSIIENNFEPVKATILQSILQNRLMESITYVNIDNILREKGINISAEKFKDPVNFENYIKVILVSEKGIESKIAGTVFIDKPKIVEIDGLYFDFAPSDYMLIIKNKDIPGVVGKLGSFLGEKNINIAGIQLGRKEKGSEAISVIGIDDKLDDTALEELKKLPNILEVSLIKL